MSSLNKFLLILIALLLIAGQFVPSVESKAEGFFFSASPPPTVTPAPTAIPVAAPAAISIPKIGIQAPVEPVSVNFDGRMNMPEDYAKVAWYSPGFKPGTPGNSVIAGHLDTTAGTPALFYNLSQLTAGDEIYVTATDGKQYIFIVTAKEIYDFDKAPIARIFGPAKERNLNLMTCAGWFDQLTQNYSQRVVVYTRLKEPV